jgi:sarcosine oxidase
VISAGAWLSKLVPGLQDIARPERQVLGWFQPHRPELFLPDRLPVFNMVVDEGHFYGLPVFDQPGFKVGKYHHLAEPIDPDNEDIEGKPRDEKVLRDFVERYFPQAGGPTLSMRRCIFTNTPDGHFIMDFHPEFPQVAIASPCSGHGFKFCSVVGEIMAELVQEGKTRHEISMFRLKRFLN